MFFKKYNFIVAILCVSALLAFSYFFFFRIDLTDDKRYSISEQTKEMMRNLDAPLNVTVYLDGDLNSGFLRLKRSVIDLLDELSIYADNKIITTFVNPSAASTSEEREKKYIELEDKGLTPTAVYEKDKEGKSIRKIIFPWLEISYGGKTENVLVLKNLRAYSGEENLNISIENLEFEIADAIRRLSNRELQKIAFLEGHNELSEAETYDISKSLSRYFQIDRGIIGNDASVLDDYKMIVVAKPTESFSETEKFIIDQYIMNGGRVLWLIDAVRIATENLSASGLSPAMELDVNLKDQFFRYGVRINPVLIQDIQSAYVPMNVAPFGEEPHFEPMPWFYHPLLLTANLHPVTKNIAEVKAEYSSALEIIGENEQLQATYLLASSDNSHLVSVPSMIDMSNFPQIDDEAYFNKAYLPVAVSLEGIFPSNYANRIPPKGIINAKSFKNESVPTRQIFVADGDIIRNEIAADNSIVALGFDRYMNQQFGNKDFVQNAVLYLADNEGWMDLRSRTLQLRLLNKKLIAEKRLNWQLLNVLLPLILLAGAGVLYQLLRKRKFTKP